MSNHTTTDKLAAALRELLPFALIQAGEASEKAYKGESLEDQGDIEAAVTTATQALREYALDTHTESNLDQIRRFDNAMCEAELPPTGEDYNTIYSMLGLGGGTRPDPARYAIVYSDGTVGPDCKTPFCAVLSVQWIDGRKVSALTLNRAPIATFADVPAPTFVATHAALARASLAAWEA